MGFDQPPAITMPAGSVLTITQTASKTVLTITPDGTMMRDGKPIDDLSPEQLREVIVDLVNLLRRR